MKKTQHFDISKTKFVSSNPFSCKTELWISFSRCYGDYEDKNWDEKNPIPSSSYAPFRIFNIGASYPVKLMDYIKEIETNIGIEAIKEFYPLQPGDVKATTADITNIQTQLGYAPSTNIRNGVKNFVDWYREYYQI